MTKKELIAKLAVFEDDDEIRIETPSHDHWNTVIARQIYSVEHARIARSDYHRADKILDEYPSEDEDTDGPVSRVVLLGTLG